MVHVAAGATVAVQVDAGVRVKSAAFVPAMETPVKVSAAVPLFVTVTAWALEEEPAAWLAKARLVGLKPIPGAMAVPVMFTICGLPAALSVTVNVAVRAAGVIDVGLKVMEIVQVAPMATVVPQVLAGARVKSVALAPPMTIPLVDAIVSGAVPVALLKVTLNGVEATPTSWPVVNATGLGVKTAAGDPAMAVPLRVIFCGLPKALSVTVSVAERPGGVSEAGVKVTLMVHDADAAKVVPQVLAGARVNSAELVPVTLRAIPVMVAAPVFVKVTV